MVKKVLVACDSFKESLSSVDVGMAIKDGITLADSSIDVDIVGIGDGGEGTIDALASSLSLKEIFVNTIDPLGNEISSYYLYDNETDTAYVELAKVSGIQLISEEEKSINTTTTRGLGMLLSDVISRSIKNIVLAIGGSATNDAGFGMLSLLGVKFFDASGLLLSFEKNDLLLVDRIDVSGLIDVSSLNVTVICDVDNVFSGLSGATRVFGAQKGATIREIEIYDSKFECISKCIHEVTGIDVNRVLGSGAAGGVGAALVAFLGGELKRGIDVMIDILELDRIASSYDLIITGEGKIDSQSLSGKVPIGIANLASRSSVRCIAIVGSADISNFSMFDDYFVGVFPVVTKIDTLENTLKDAYNNVVFTSYNVFKLLGL